MCYYWLFAGENFDATEAAKPCLHVDSLGLGSVGSHQLQVLVFAVQLSDLQSSAHPAFSRPREPSV